MSRTACSPGLSGAAAFRSGTTASPSTWRRPPAAAPRPSEGTFHPAVPGTGRLTQAALRRVLTGFALRLAAAAGRVERRAPAIGH